MRKFLIIGCLAMAATAAAQFEGGSGSGQIATLLASTSGCAQFLGGGASGYDTAIIASTFNCMEYMGAAGSGAASLELKGECVMYWGDSVSGYQSAVLATTQNCLFFKGEQGGGYAQNTYFTPFVCPSFLSSGRDDGAASRSYTDDNGVCFITVPIEASPLFGEVKFGDDGYLHWKTYSELNNRGFAIEKSLDAVNWTEIGWRDGVGNSVEERDYDFWDYDLGAAVQYYRFRQVDFDGTAALSNVVALSLSESQRPQYFVQVFPNPVLGGQDLQVRTWLPEALRLNVQVRDVLGRELYFGHFEFEEGTSRQAISTEQWPAGTYFLNMQTEDARYHWALPFVVVR